MIFFIAPCVLAASIGPLTPATAVQRRNAAVAEAVRVTLIDGTLTPRPAQLVQVDSATDAAGRTSGTLIVIDERGARTSTPIAGPGGEILALAPAWWVVDDATALTQPPPRPATAGPGPVSAAGDTRAATVFLTDGQRFIGQFAPGEGAPGADQAIRWSHPLLGTLALPLESIRRISLRPQADGASGGSIGAPPDRDSVLLVNGDRLAGYVESIGGQPEAGVALSRTDGKAPPVTIALEQVAEITLSNPEDALRGVVLWLGDSSVAAARRFDVDAASGRMTVSLRVPGSATDQSGAVSSLDLADLRAVTFDAGRIVPLSGLPVASTQPRGGRRLAEGPRRREVTPGWPSPLGADDIELPGPMLADWVLPPRASRLAGWVSLDPGAAAWGDCEVVLSVVPGRETAGDDGPVRELVRQRISAASPVLSVNAALPTLPQGGRLRIVVEAGTRGPIQDRVVLRRMCVLTERAASEGSAPR